MSETTVYFATDRQPDPSKPGGYGAEIVDPADPSKVMYAVVPVTGIDLTNESSGQLGPIAQSTMGNFSDAVRAEIEATARNLLVFIHGFDNTFEDSLKRSAFNREWFADSGTPAADTTILAFCWPSAGTLFESLPNPPDAAYLADQNMAAQSCLHLAVFLRNVLTLVADFRRAGRRSFLLAHSMGNHALSCAIPSFFASSTSGSLETFSEAILPAADEVNTTLQVPGTGMYRLRDLTERISVYSSLRDVAMDLSMAVNKNIRLGYDGPADKTNTSIYQPATFRSVNCTEVFDYFGLIPPDATHQYYRRSKTVRADIVKLMANQLVTPGVSSLSALPFGV